MEISRNRIELARLFVEMAGHNLEVARDLLKGEHYPDSCYYSQQCAEKIMKAVLILENKFIKEHILSEIFSSSVKTPRNWKERLDRVCELSAELEEHWVKPRYPHVSKRGVWHPLREYTKEKAEDALAKAIFVFENLTEFLREVYKIEV